MDCLRFVLSAVARRISQIKREIMLIDEQIDVMNKIAGMDGNEAGILLCSRQILDGVLSMFLRYKTGIDNLQLRHVPLFKLASCHAKIMCIHAGFFGGKIQEIEERQLSLGELTESIEDIDTGDSMKMMNGVSKFFPYGDVYRIFKDGHTFRGLLKIILEDMPKQCERAEQTRRYTRRIRAVLKLVSPSGMSERSKIATVMLVETILWFFTGELMRGLEDDVVESFQVNEICRLLVNGDVKDLGIRMNVLDGLPPFESSQDQGELPYVDGDNELGFEYDRTSMIPALRHVVLEIRKLTTQVSVSMMYIVLQRAMEWLNVALAARGSTVGADESFPFFVAILCDAKLRALPTIIRILQGYTIVDLKTSRSSFVLTRIEVALDFIKARNVNVPPRVLFPFLEHSVLGLELQSRDPIKLPGFAVYAFPTFVPSIYPAIVCCTGNSKEEAVVYSYVTDGHSSKGRARWNRSFEAIATQRGLLVTMTCREAEAQLLVRIDDSSVMTVPNFAEEIASFSNLFLMCSHGIKAPRLSHITELSENFVITWRREVNRSDVRGSVKRIVREIQNALIAKGKLKAGYIVTGNIDVDMIEAIRAAVPAFQKGDFFIDPRVRAFICHGLPQE